MSSTSRTNVSKASDQARNCSRISSGPFLCDQRFSPSRKLRLSPLIYFSESPSHEGIRACAAMGFDDVVTLPFSRERVTARLGIAAAPRELHLVAAVPTLHTGKPDRRAVLTELTRLPRGDQ